MRLNPLAKFAMLVVFSTLAMLVTNVYIMLGFVSIVIICTFALGKLIAKRSVAAFSVTIFAAQLVFERSGSVIWKFSIFSITTGGIEAGIIIAGRFACVIALSSLFISTTKPSELSYALASTGFPYRYGFLLVLAMRFVPIFQVELSTVREAQVMRGLMLEKSASGMYRATRYTMLPMLISALSRVNTLAASMEGRGFGAFETRTALRPCAFGKADALAIVLSIISAIFALSLGEALA